MNQIDCDQSYPETHIAVIFAYYFLLKGYYKPTLSPMYVSVTGERLILRNALETRLIQNLHFWMMGAMYINNNKKKSNYFDHSLPLLPTIITYYFSSCAWDEVD